MDNISKIEMWNTQSVLANRQRESAILDLNSLR